LTSTDLDRSNLGNARLQGLPQDILGGDPTGVLFDWVNSVFFFTYVSFRTPGFGRVPVTMDDDAALDTPASSVHGPVEVLQPAYMDWLLCYSLGDMFHVNGLKIHDLHFLHRFDTVSLLRQQHIVLPAWWLLGLA
jgi:hypothetical protein